jgi:hypothetical protein
MLEVIDLAAASVAQAAGAAASERGITPEESLIAALTMEGLLFAAFSIGYGLSGSSRRGRSKFFTQGWFGWGVVAVITLVAAGAAVGWWETFHPGWPANFGELLLGAGLALGIVAQPLFAAAINSQAESE